MKKYVITVGTWDMNDGGLIGDVSFLLPDEQCALPAFERDKSILDVIRNSETILDAIKEAQADDLFYQTLEDYGYGSWYDDEPAPECSELKVKSVSWVHYNLNICIQYEDQTVIINGEEETMELILELQCETRELTNV